MRRRGPLDVEIEVATRIAALREQQEAWARLDVAQRSQWVRRYGRWLLDHRTEIERLLIDETGKPAAQAGVELPFVVHHLAYNARIAPKALRERSVLPHSVLVSHRTQRLRREPYPVVGVISPWNFPLALSLIDAVPALLAGAAVAVKPSELTPLSVTAAVDGWREIGAPDVFAALTGGPETGRALVDEVDFVQFTGSTATGRAVAMRCAERLVPCSVEMGGKDAMLVLRGADVERAVNATVWGALANSGQMCTSVERVYVHTDLYEEFVRRLVEEVASLRPGRDLGPLASTAQAEIVRSQLADAREGGARVLTGGEGQGRWVPPTVLVDVDDTMRCLREESFGPLIPVMEVADDEEAVQRANATAYGLSAHVFGPDDAETQATARRLSAGAVSINDVAANLTALALPQQGWGESGLGFRFGGPQGIRKYTRSQAIVTARWPVRREPTWFPFTAVRTGRVSRALTAANRTALAPRPGRPGRR